MPGPQPPAVPVSVRLRAVVARLVRRQTLPQRVVRRLRIVLGLADGLNNEHLAGRLGLDRSTVRTWRARWQTAVPRLEAAVGEEEERVLSQRVLDALDDAPRAGAPATFSAEQVVQIVAIACEPPPASDRPTSHWTPEELVDEAVKRGIVASISSRSVGRFLGSGRPQAAPEPLLAHPQAGRPRRLRRAGGDRV